jgi:hypothetical protein
MGFLVYYMRQDSIERIAGIFVEFGFKESIKEKISHNDKMLQLNLFLLQHERSAT